MDRDEPTGDGYRVRADALLRDSLLVVGSAILVAILLVAVSGVWPPLVAIESGSMEPNIGTGDMVFVMSEERFPGPDARHGVVTANGGVDYRRFGRPGDVIIFVPDGNTDRTPIIHRAMLYVEDGENWYGRAEPDAVGVADNCRELANCPAPHAGYITQGDAVRTYDQARPTTTTVVRPEWVVGTAESRVPELGWVRLT